MAIVLIKLQGNRCSLSSLVYQLFRDIVNSVHEVISRADAREQLCEPAELLISEMLVRYSYTVIGLLKNAILVGREGFQNCFVCVCIICNRQNLIALMNHRARGFIIVRSRCMYQLTIKIQISICLDIERIILYCNCPAMFRHLLAMIRIIA